MVSTTEPTVSSSLSAGSTTEIVRDPLAASSSATVHEGLLQLWSVSQRLPAAASVAGQIG